MPASPQESPFSTASFQQKGDNRGTGPGAETSPESPSFPTRENRGAGSGEPASGGLEPVSPKIFGVFFTAN